MTRYVHTRAATRKAMQSSTTRRALAKKARRMAVQANTLGAAEGVDIDAEVVEGTRPLGRPFAQVLSRNVGQEWGDRWTERRRILGRMTRGS